MTLERQAARFDLPNDCISAACRKMVGEPKGAGNSAHHLQSRPEHDQGSHFGKIVARLQQFPGLTSNDTFALADVSPPPPPLSKSVIVRIGTQAVTAICPILW